MTGSHVGWYERVKIHSCNNKHTSCAIQKFYLDNPTDLQTGRLQPKQTMPLYKIRLCTNYAQIYEVLLNAYDTTFKASLLLVKLVKSHYQPQQHHP